MDNLSQLYVYNLPSSLLASITPRNNSQLADAQSSAGLEDAASSDEEDYSDEEAEVASTQQQLQQASLQASQSTESIIVSSKGSPITWFTAKVVPAPTKIGIFTAVLPTGTTTVQSLQLTDDTERSVAMFMTGGGHFQGAIISLNESSSMKCAIKASKGFHRYTTRRKQGGAQSANDNAKGAAQSAGAQIRRYNEIALADDVRELIKEWSAMLEKVEVILIRASGPSSKKLLFDNGLGKQDPRVRGFPLNTRRATQSEIIRSFHALTRLQVGSTLDDVVVAKPLEPSQPAKPAEKAEDKPDPVLVEHTDKLISLIKRNKAPGVRAYLQEHKIAPTSFRLEPRKSYIHAPTLLHYAAVSDAAPCVLELLNLDSDPTITNSAGKTAFEVADNKKTREAFRIYRGANEQRWDWEAARIPVGLSAEQVAARQAKEAEERAAQEAAETARRAEETSRLAEEARQAQEAEQREMDKRRGPARSLAAGLLGTSSPTASLEGLTPQMRQKIERERRARAAEARFKK